MRIFTNLFPRAITGLFAFIILGILLISQISLNAYADEINLAWNYADGAYGYNLYYGLESKSYDSAIDVGPQPQYEVKLSDLETDAIYYFAVTAYNEFGESDFSEEISFKTPADSTSILGNPNIYPNITTSGNRRAVPYTMPEDGTITSITTYHEAGSGMMLLGLYTDDGQGEPGIRLEMSAENVVSSIAGWQTVDLISPVFVPGGTTIWLAWVYENNPGIRYQTGTPGRAQSTELWDYGMPDTYGPCSIDNYIYSIYATYIPGYATSENLGNTEVFSNTTTRGQRRAVPYTMVEDGTITSITTYHEAGSGMMLLGLYADDGQGEPGIRLEMSAETVVSSIAGWQTVDLISPVFIPGGTTIWLAWVYENNPGIRYQTGTPGRAQSTELWDYGMPDTYGLCSIDNYIYSIYATYIPIY